MTRERREEVVLAALIVSLVVHVGLMLLVKSQRMAMANVSEVARARREPIKVVRHEFKPSPKQIDDLLDLQPVKERPIAEVEPVAPNDLNAPNLAMSSAADATMPTLTDGSIAVPEMPAEIFEAVIIDSIKPSGPAVMPILESPKAGLDMSRPKFSTELPRAEFRAGMGAPAIGLSQAKSPRETMSRVPMRKVAPTFTPSAEVFSHVDTTTVAKEKEAVRILVDAPDAEELDRVVEVGLSTCVKDGYRYFRIKMSPRADLEIVPKDVVVLLDGSGSIGNDRLASCRKAARRILRTCTNTGDRFNLVVFRNAFSYAFSRWQECDSEGFDRADAWLARQSSHGRTDVFSTIASVLTLPRDPKRPLIALVVTDGDANEGVSNTADIIARFTSLNDGLVSVYMYGVKSSANRELIDVLTHGNRGESLIYGGMRFSSGNDLERLSERFRDPVLSDLRIVFSTISEAEAYPRLLKNIYRGGMLEFVGRLPMAADRVAFSLRGQSCGRAFESFFSLPFGGATVDSSIAGAWKREHTIDLKLMQ